MLLVAGCTSGSDNADPFAFTADEEPQVSAMLAAEDRRGRGDDLATLVAGIESDNPTIRMLAVRGIGRLERPALLSTIDLLLDDEVSSVRATAANATAQSVSSGDDEAVAEAARLLNGRVAGESDPAVRGALAAALGRLPYRSPGRISQVADDLVALSREQPVETVQGAVRGLESLARNPALLARRDRQDYQLTDPAMRRLGELTRYGRSGAEGYIEPPDGQASEAERGAYVDALRLGTRVRRLAIASLVAAGRGDAETIETALYDPDTEVRRLAALAAARLDNPARLDQLLHIGLGDDAGTVRYEALRAYGSARQESMGCDPVLQALDDESAHVRLLAIDLLGDGCPAIDPVGRLVPILDALAGDAPEGGIRDGINPPIGAGVSRATPPVEWHAGAHALLAVARLDSAAAAARLPLLARHPTWQVRMYTARAAAITGSVDTLEALADDPYDNVANAAISGLVSRLGSRTHGSAVQALMSNDYQLLISAARNLEGTDHPGALAALTSALARITEQRRETSRDTRRALLDRIGELGGTGDAAALVPLLRDFDPVIAARAAEILSEWTGTAHQPDPQPLDPVPVPTVAELRELRDARVLVHMSGGGVIELRLLAFAAPTNATRFARLAGEGYFDGLTFHRVVPNFVIQGGSPGANEFMGDGPYTRDEVTARPHLRGTMGLSTRGRDTGDGQIFVNLVDNIRLDHGYTIFAVVVGGMEVVDGILEGATIETVQIVAPEPEER